MDSQGAAPQLVTSPEFNLVLAAAPLGTFCGPYVWSCLQNPFQLKYSSGVKRNASDFGGAERLDLTEVNTR